MTQQQIHLIQQSWKMIKPIGNQAGFLFYEKLFAMAPEIRHLFQQDISNQAGKLVSILGTVVSNLEHLEGLLPHVQRLGANHNRYGALPKHYDVVGQCIIETLRDALGCNWNIELELAWTSAFKVLKDIMIQAQEMDLELSMA